MRGRRLPIGLSATLSIFTVVLFATSTWVAAQETALHSFNHNGTDGYSSQAGLIVDASGNLYGTTGDGGTGIGCASAGCGTVFELTPTAGGGWTEKVLYSFGGPPDGRVPLASLVSDAAGNLYGTTQLGGTYDLGTAFELTLTAGGGWTEKVLYSFCPQTGCADGEFIDAGLIFDAAGNLYGTTYYGGTQGDGTVFELTPTAGGGWTQQVLHSFVGNPDGESPLAGLILDAAGNLYGTTEYGGTYGLGTVFELSPTGGGIWTEQVLHSFVGYPTDGATPAAGLIFSAAGNLYGTTGGGGTGVACGTGGCGTVFELMPTAGGGWTETVLHSFNWNGTDGFYPEAGLIFDGAGNLYGTTEYGGIGSCLNDYYGYLDCGTVFELSPGQGGNWTETVLYNFNWNGNGTDGAFPLAGLILDAAGNLYGTTLDGGIYSYGMAFELGKLAPTSTALTTAPNPSTPGQNVTMTATVTAQNGSLPTGTVVFQSNGIQIGSASLNNSGITVLNYAGLPVGTNSLTAMYQGSATLGGSTSNTVMQVVSSASNDTLTVFISGNGTVTSTDGFINCPSMCSHLYPANMPVTLNATPATGSMFAGWSGACTGTGSCSVTMTQNLSVTAAFSQLNYILTASTNGSGTVTSTDGDIACPGTCGYSYPINAQVTLNAMAATGWTFAGWSAPCSGTGSCTVTLTQDMSVSAMFTQNPDNYTLTVSIGGSGTVKSTDLNINCPGVCSYTYPSNMQVSLSAMPGQNGMFSNWSGACSGGGGCQVTMTQNLSVTAVFSGAQQEIVLHSFGHDHDGQDPFANLVSDSAGNLYSTTSGGGRYGKGAVFEVSPSGTETVLYSFANGNDGQNPLGNLIFDSAGNLYGTTSKGGTYGYGTAFELSPAGTETVLYSFGGGADGQNPSAGLIFDTSGNLYGTTYGGGAYNYGTAFELSPNGAGGWTERVAYSFGNGSDGRNPSAGLIFDTSGNLYGTTQNGGLYGGGMAFELSPNGIGCCRESPLYSFGNGAGDGQHPYAGLTFDTSGNLYGTTSGGGTYSYGTAFELSPNGAGGWTETVAYSFGNGSDGRNPSAGLIFDASGNLYGTTQNGGLYSGGMVFELSPSGIGCCRESPLYSFGNGAGDGQHPYAGLIFGGSGNLYGTTQNGGLYSGGTLFQIMLPPSPVQFVSATPCRLVDTRNPDGTFAGPPISGGTARSFPLAQSGNPCNIPSNVIAYSLNVTVVPQHPLGYLTIWPTGDAQPLVSTMNSPDGRVKANAAIVLAGTPSGAVSVYVTDTTNIILDIDGYFVAGAGNTLAFYPLTPCRVVDTRQTNFPQGLGAPRFANMETRELPVLTNSPCLQGLPNTPQAYSFNVTAVPNPAGQSLNYLTIWPSNDSQPLVSTLNNPTATVVANAAIVPADPANGDVSVFTYNSTDVIIDINGYFAAPGTGGLSLYSVAPCRVLDTRNNNGQPFIDEKTVNVVGSACALPSNAQAYVFNATVVPPGQMPYLTLWADGQQQPVVSTLNAYDGFITSNLAIVPTTNGSIDAYAYALTQLIIDISGYFAP